MDVLQEWWVSPLTAIRGLQAIAQTGDLGVFTWNIRLFASDGTT
jgi:hypothetical protein